MKKVAVLLALIVVLYLFWPDSSPLSPLYTSGNQILSAETEEPVRLQGVTSDYFRYFFNHNYPTKYGGLEGEMLRLTALKKMRPELNLVVLYLQHLSRTINDLAVLDEYIQRANELGMYVLLAPVSYGFKETVHPDLTSPGKEYWKDIAEGDLAKFIKLLAERYGSNPSILFQMVAEPPMSREEWKTMEAGLASIVRQYTENIIVASTPYYFTYQKPFPAVDFTNAVYSVGGYLKKNDQSSRIERQMQDVLGEEELRASYPVLVIEFGGNYGGDFSSPHDLSLFTELLNKVQGAELSFSMYRLSSAFENDGLALFDTANRLTAKGEIFINSFRK